MTPAGQMTHAGRSPLRVGACLSLSGRFSRFGRQAARALEAWASLDGGAQLLIEDDASDVKRLRSALPQVAAASDLLLGPYSTLLMRAAAEMAAGAGWTLWNHGGSGGDAEAARPGHVVSVLTPAGRYAEPFLARLATGTRAPAELCIAYGTGRFGRQVAEGAETSAQRLGITRLRSGPADELLSASLPVDWILFTAGTFEHDIQAVTLARSLPNPPQFICAIAAGVREFGQAIMNPAGTFGIAQWFPRTGRRPRLGPTEEQFLTAYSTPTAPPDYPAVQAAAAAVIAAHCARIAQTTRPDALWQAASSLKTSTLFGEFEIDAATGAQTSHQTVLLQWTSTGRLALA